jgi:hypothetical protein
VKDKTDQIARLERLACHPSRVEPAHFNSQAEIPFRLTVEHIAAAMNDFVDFIGFINQQLATRKIERLETMLMPANFSSIVGEFMTSSIPKHCKTLVKNAYHNGHPDLIPAGKYHDNKLQHGTDGIEVKGSRYLKSWQGHNAEDAWLMVFCFSSGRPTDEVKGILPSPFKFILVAGAQLTKSDWNFAGRSETSRRTITASVTQSGYEKMMANWIYKEPDLIEELVEDSDS